MKQVLSFLFLTSLFCGLWAQSTPYFQQTVNYDIQVRLDDEKHQLHGKEKLIYQNNSPDELAGIYMHLWPNAYSQRNTAFGRQEVRNGSTRFYDGVGSHPGFIDSLDFRVDGVQVKSEAVGDDPDIVYLSLPKPLAPGASIEITTPFRVQIPPSYSRLGHIGQQYQLTQWYPKPAVYDRNGWHPMPYLSQGEFYSEFGTFDVYITVPKNYVVGATGDLPPDDPERKWLARRETLSKKMLLKPGEESQFEPEFGPNETKTLHFHQEKVHDFAWFCDQNYYVLSKKVKLPFSEREVDCVAMFTNLDRELWVKAPEYIAKSVYDYSYWNGDYPYNHATAVDGALSAGAGMEYPNITVLGAGGSATALETVVMHEVGHNWFYGILGSNERDHPWMDEGLNTFMEGRYWQKHHQDTLDMIPSQVQDAIGLQLTHTSMAQIAYQLTGGEGTDQPIELESDKYTNLNYGTIVYMKTGLAFEYLKAYLGEDVIDKCFRTYFDRWKFKHPQPADIQAVFEEVSGKDLGWFFGEFLNGVHKLDFGVAGVKDGQATLVNRSGLPMPVSLTLVNEQGEELQTLWTEPFEGKTTLELPQQDYHRLEVYAGDYVPDLQKGNNFRRSKGLFKKCHPPHLSFGYGFPQPDQYDLGLLPAFGYNTLDGFMGGVLLHHGQFPTQKFKWHLMPMYGFRSNRITGSAGGTLTWRPTGIFRKIDLSVRASAFSTLVRSRQALTFHLRREDGGDRKHRVGLENFILGYHFPETDLAPDDWYLPVLANAFWDTEKSDALYSMNTHLEIGGNVADQLGRVLGSVDYRRRLAKKTHLGLRVFGGYLLHEGPTPLLYQLGISGSADRLGEHIVFDRVGANSWNRRQLIPDHGGFSSALQRYFDQGLVSTNLVFETRFPLQLVGDFGYGMSRDLGGESFYGLSLRLPLLQGLAQINFPVLGSVYDGAPSSFREFGQAITFSFDPMRMLRKTAGQFIDLN